MKPSSSSLEGVGIRYGLFMTLGLIAYFLIMKLVGLVHVIELRTVNAVILVTFVWLGLKKFENQHDHEIEYLQGIGLGILTSAVGVILFSIFIFFYLQLDNDLMASIRDRETFGQYLNPYILAFVIALEGIASGFIATFIIMQYLKKSRSASKNPDR